MCRLPCHHVLGVSSRSCPSSRTDPAPCWVRAAVAFLGPRERWHISIPFTQSSEKWSPAGPGCAWLSECCTWNSHCPVRVYHWAFGGATLGAGKRVQLHSWRCLAGASWLTSQQDPDQANGKGFSVSSDFSLGPSAPSVLLMVQVSPHGNASAQLVVKQVLQLY